MTATSVGSLFEWYDFYLAATAAATVWPKIFFPARFDPAVALAVSISTLGIAYIARPVGALVFGHIGDKYGRRNTLVWNLLLMGISSLGTALLPPYVSIGMIALGMVFVFRFLVGAALGGELGGALSWIAEARPDSKHRGFWMSWPIAVLQIGTMMSVFAFYLASSLLSSTAYLDWGWRIPFVVGALMVVVALVIRLRVMESPLFKQLQAKRSVLKSPAFQVIREQWRKMFTLMWVDPYITGVAILVMLPYSISYLTKLGVNESFATLTISAGNATAFVTMLVGGYVSDYVGRLKVLRIGAVLCVAMLFPYFFLLNTTNPLWIIVAQMLAYGLTLLPAGSNKALYTESYPTKYRYSGSGLTFQLGQLVLGVLVMLVLPLFLTTYGVLGAWLPIVGVCIALVVLSMVSSFFVKETAGIKLE
jgi:MFS family permease